MQPTPFSPPTFPETFNLADYLLFDRLKQGREGHTAIRFGAERWSYGGVAERVRTLRTYFALAGVPREQRVLIILPDSPAFAWALFATFYHGAVVAMGNPDAPTADLAYLVEYTAPAAVVTLGRVAVAIAPTLLRHRDLRALILVPEVATGGDVESEVHIPAGLDTLKPVSLGEALLRGRKAQAATPPPRPTRRDDIAMWLFTSGSTGKSKAALHCHRDFAFNTECYAKHTVGYRPDDVTLSVSRLFFGYATGTNLFFPFAVGATTVLCVERPTPASIAAAIARYHPTIVTNVPTMLGRLLDEDDALRAAGKAPLELGSVRFHLSAGEALPEALYTRFKARFGGEIYDGIGSAEMFHIYASNRPGDVRPGSLGRAVDGYTLKILPVDAAGPGAEPLPPGETGVLWVAGDSVAMGYHQDRDKSWRTFHGYWCKTGDLFHIDAAGYLWFSGRADDLLKVGGQFVAPIEVEECLLQHPAVSLAAVIGAADEEGLIKPKAFVVVRENERQRLATAEGCAALTEALQAHVRSALSKHKYPRWIVFVDDLPKNDRGKVDRRILRDNPDFLERQ